MTGPSESPQTGIGLEVVRYGSREITALLGGSFQLLEIVRETHLTPGKARQQFCYFRLQRLA